MFDDSDEHTRVGLFELRDSLKKQKPVILWLGAGFSKWGGFPLWSELAEQLHRQFKSKEAGYKAAEAHRLLLAQDFPQVFSAMRRTNSGRFYTCLEEALSVRAPTHVFNRALSILQTIVPLKIFTTNIDEMLEANLPKAKRFQRSNIEFVLNSLHTADEFVYKLHGTSSEIQRSIWTTEDYANLALETDEIRLVGEALAQSTVIFLGYGLRDQYVVDLLSAAHAGRPILGDGPHFAVQANSRRLDLPPSVKQLRYLTNTHADHRGALTALTLVQSCLPTGPSLSKENPSAERPILKSAFYLPDYFPPGTWQTSITADFADETGKLKGRFVVGPGFVDGEMQTSVTTSLHDLLVGLICFDRVYLPLGSIGLLHHDLGSNVFWSLLDNDVLRFVWAPGEIGVIFSVEEPFFNGAIASVQTMDRDRPSEPAGMRESILRQIQSVNIENISNEKVAERIEAKVIAVPAEIAGAVTAIARGALIEPGLRRNLGMSDGILSEKLPTWFAYPALRVAQVVRDAEVCRHLEIASAKLPFGSEHLANATYGIVASENTASHFASYVAVGRFNADLGRALFKSPELLNKIMTFRAGTVGVEFREKILHCLQTNDGAEFVASVNSSLKENIPLKILDNARSHFVDVSFSENATAVWSDQNRGSDAFHLWRRRSADILSDIMSTRKIGNYDPCPCGSGDKLKFCCGPLLEERSRRTAQFPSRRS